MCQSLRVTSTPPSSGIPLLCYNQAAQTGCYELNCVSPKCTSGQDHIWRQDLYRGNEVKMMSSRGPQSNMIGVLIGRGHVDRDRCGKTM